MYYVLDNKSKYWNRPYPRGGASTLGGAKRMAGRIAKRKLKWRQASEDVWEEDEGAYSIKEGLPR